MKYPLSLRGLKRILLPRRGETDSDAEGVLARAAFGPLPGLTEGKGSGGLVDFLGQVTLCEELSRTERLRLARSAHERSYGDGESIYERGRLGQPSSSYERASSRSCSANAMARKCLS